MRLRVIVIFGDRTQLPLMGRDAIDVGAGDANKLETISRQLPMQKRPVFYD